jgi:AcrR family transcriptional regulator
MSSDNARKGRSPGKRGLSRTDWIEVALDTLESEGIQGVKVERLAAKLKIARSSFYWHFKNQRDLLDHLLAYWAHEYTGVATDNEELRKLAPKDRLLRTMEMISNYNLVRFEVPIRAWADHDPAVKKAVDKAYEMRLDFAREAFSEMGFEGADLEMRTRLFVCYHTWEQAMFGGQSSRGASTLRRLRLELLTTPLADGKK